MPVRMSDDYRLMVDFTGGVANTREVTKGLKELAKANGIRGDHWNESRGPSKIYTWAFDVPTKKAAKELAHAAYMIFASACNRGGSRPLDLEERLEFVAIYIDKDPFKIPKKWKLEAIENLRFYAYQKAGGVMSREDFDRECQEPGGLERVFFEEGLKRDRVVMA